jgi:DNA-binding transcriptional LysR family regulator
MPSVTRKPPVELWALQVFVEVATTRSMTQAATRLGLTQSAVSQAVRKLETDLDVALLERGRRPVALTAAGTLLERRAELLLRDAAQIPHALLDASLTSAHEIRLGLVDTFASTAGPELINELTGATTRVVVWSGLAPSLGAALIGHEVDAIVTPDMLDDLDGLDRFPLWREPFILLLPKARKAGANRLTLQGLAATLPMIRYSARSHAGLQIERHLRRIGVSADRRIEVDGSDSLVAMVAAGVGWAITTPLCLLQGAAHAHATHPMPLPSPRFSRTLSLVCRQESTTTFGARTAEAAARALRRSCLPRLQILVPQLADGIIISGADGSGGVGFIAAPGRLQ